jgi:hypothetical protein
MQDQKLTTINLQPGIIKEQTQKAAEGFWVDGDKIRFRFGKPELIGGWQKTFDLINNADLIGFPRALETTRALVGFRAALIGTDIGVFSSNLQSYNNVTPIVDVVPLVSVINTSAGSPTIVVSVSAHGLTPGTLVAFTSADTTIGGTQISLVSTTTLYQISVIDENSFAFDVPIAATETSTNAGDGSTAVFYYPAGPASNTFVGGWGTGVWSGPFGWSESLNGSFTLPLRLWSFDHWGTDIVAVPSGGPLFYWDVNSGIGAHLSIVSAAPARNQIVRVESEARHVILYGTEDVGNNYDPLLIRWSNREDYTDWTIAETSRAGDFRLNAKGSRIINVTRAGSQYLILTDAEAFAQSFIGGNDVFGFAPIGKACGAISQNCAVEYAGNVYWMSNSGQFFKYDGRVEPLSCTVLRYVYDSLSPTQREKIVAGTIAQFDEVIWFYPSTQDPAAENDRYVIYNVREQHWTIGRLARTVWKDRTTFPHPIGGGLAGEGLFYHELGYAADTSVLSSHLQSAYFDLGDGDDILFANKIAPDFYQPNGDPLVGRVEMSLRSRKYPGAPIITKGPYPVSAATDKISTRLRGREISIEIVSSCDCAAPWRLGEMRLALQPDGKR